MVAESTPSIMRTRIDCPAGTVTSPPRRNSPRQEAEPTLLAQHQSEAAVLRPVQAPMSSE